MPLLDHLIELRNRLIYSVAALFIGFLACFFFAADIFAFLVRPLADILAEEEGRRMIFTGLPEKFFVHVKVAFFAGAFLSSPSSPASSGFSWRPACTGMKRRRFCLI